MKLVKNRNHSHSPIRMPIMVLTLFLAGVLLQGCGLQGTSANEERYGEIIAGLEDDEPFALVDIGEKEDVLFVTDATFDDKNGNDAALQADVYFAIDGQTYLLGKIESMGTAYPLAFGKKCIYTASQNFLQIYEIDHVNHCLTLKTQYEAVYGEADEDFYRCIWDGEEEIISQEAYEDALDTIYETATVIDFGYGAN